MYATTLGVAFLVALGSALSIDANATDCADNLGERPTAAQIIACMGELQTELAAVTSSNNELRGQLDTMLQQQAEQPMPPGAVMAFDLPEGCPAGWAQFGDAAGRTIIGSGGGMTDQNNQPLSGRKYREHGGEEAHVLTHAEMPAHDHGLETWLSSEPNQPPRPEDQGNVAVFGRYNELYLKDFVEGSGASHNNMPPYIALYFCKYEGTG